MNTATAPAPAKSTSRLLGLSRETLMSWYDDMLLVRRFEEKCAQLYGMGQIMGFCHLYNGTGSRLNRGYQRCDNARRLRDHGLPRPRSGHFQRRRSRKILAELLGKYTGTTKGKGGSMHIFDRETNFLGGHAIVGAHIPLATGWHSRSSIATRRKSVSVSWRRCHEHRCVSRRPQPCRALEASGDLYHRKQQVRHGDLSRPGFCCQ